MSPLPSARVRPAQAGFILPGVVMFVVVLTILGLSLFALSGYEGQFMNKSLDKTETFYSANGAIDRARFLLSTPPFKLSTVATNLGPGVVYAVAHQGVAGPPDGSCGACDSLGPVQWNNGEPIWIRAMARKNRDSTLVEAQFDPNWGQPYENLFSLSSTSPTRKGLFVSKGASGWYPHYYTKLDGMLWQAWSGPGWDADIFPLGNPPLGVYDPLLRVTLAAVPPPQVGTFVSQHTLGAQAPIKNGNHFTLTGFTFNGDPVPTYFLTTPPAPDSQYSLRIDKGPPISITVSGISIWMFDSGFRTNRTITVNGTGILVLCARSAPINDFVFGPVNLGFGFEGGISSNIPLIVVTDGFAIFDSNPDGDDPPNTDDGEVSSDVDWLAVFADDAYVRGPDPAHHMYLTHPSSSPAAEANLKTLIDRDALPNAAATKRFMAYRPGSWRVIEPNPN